MTVEYSRGSMLLFYVIGLPSIVLTRYALVSTVILGSKVGLVTAQRVFLIGSGEDISGFVRRYQPWNFGLHTVGAAPLTRLDSSATRQARREALAADLRQAIDTARTLRPDAVYIVSPWSETGTIDSCVDEFLNIPVEIHLGPERILDRFDNVRIAKHGRMASLQLTRAPLSWFERMQKRLLDLTVAAGVLVALSPVLAVVALLILLESGRPVFFRQRRYGFNQQEFRIIKFRTMTTLDDGDVVRRRRRNDPRVTGSGASCASGTSTNCRNCSTCSGATCRWSARARTRCRTIANTSRRSRSMRGATTSSPGSPAGRRSTASVARPTPTRRCAAAWSTISTTSTAGRSGSTSGSWR